MFELPTGWEFNPPTAPDQSITGGPESLQFGGPGGEQFGAISLPASADKTLADASTYIRDSIKKKVGVDPEQTEHITLGGAPAELLTYHFTTDGVKAYDLDAFCVHDDRVYELSLGDEAGNEEHDRALMLAFIASFEFMR